MNAMEKLFADAEAKGHWLYCCYQGLWFSPNELKSQQANGKFLWGASNWSVRDPQEGLDSLTRKVGEAQKEVDAFRGRMQK